jgi:DNA-binding transcriptional ArsR family regulator
MSAETHPPFPLTVWDWGTAYDLFASLHVLHHPDRFGLRGAWAAGVRSRLPASQRSLLEDAQDVIFPPVAWLYTLPAPKDAATALRSLEQIPPADRLPALVLNADQPAEYAAILNEIAARHTWSDQDMERVRSILQQRGRAVGGKTVLNIMKCWSQPAEFGERYLEALQAYQAVFFAEEERRIQPYLQNAVLQAQAVAGGLPFNRLVVHLTQGVEIAALVESAEVVFAPSYWTTPLVIYARLDATRMLLLFGCRPVEAALVPGELVPDALLQALKALADPTRLRILRYLAAEPLTPSQLSSRLRLRAPTMIHHLNTLRLAGLVHLSLDKQGEKRYAMRKEHVAETFEVMNKFLSIEENAE